MNLEKALHELFKWISSSLIDDGLIHKVKFGFDIYGQDIQSSKTK
jgi:hypothetical protein